MNRTRPSPQGAQGLAGETGIYNHYSDMIAAGGGVCGWWGPGAGSPYGAGGWWGSIRKAFRSWKQQSRQTRGKGTQWKNMKGKQERLWHVRTGAQAACRVHWGQRCKRQVSAPHVSAMARLGPAPRNSHLLEALPAHSPSCSAHGSRPEPPVLTPAGAPRPLP